MLEHLSLHSRKNHKELCIPNIHMPKIFHDIFLWHLSLHSRKITKLLCISNIHMSKIFHVIFLWHLSLHSRKSQNCSVFQIFICLKYSKSFSYGIYLSIPEKITKALCIPNIHVHKTFHNFASQ